MRAAGTRAIDGHEIRQQGRSDMAHTAREAVAVFSSEQTLEAAIDDLERHGFDRAEISLLAGEGTVEKKLRHRYRRVEQAEDYPNAPRLSFVSDQSVHEAEGAAIGFPLYIGATTATGIAVAAGGPISAAIGAALIGGSLGGLIGGLLAGWIGAERADFIDSQLAQGGLVLWVRTRDAAHEKKALDILAKHSPHDVHIHAVPDWALDS
jgi:hypothetical protein